MARGICLSIGLNSVSPSSYNGWEGRLGCCENDAKALSLAANGKGYETIMLLTRDATSINVLNELYMLSKSLSPEDILIVYYSGHGSQISDDSFEEEDLKDETWCLYDRMLVDDELYAMFSKFNTGTRVWAILDSCHSGTAIKEYPVIYPGQNGRELAIETNVEYKCAPEDISIATYNANQYLYKTVKYLTGASDCSQGGASVLLISGCQDNQRSRAGNPNSKFTEQLLSVWNNGMFKGNYKQFCDKIGKLLPETQSPNYYLAGATNLAFEAQTPFTI